VHQLRVRLHAVAGQVVATQEELRQAQAQDHLAVLLLAQVVPLQLGHSGLEDLLQALDEPGAGADRGVLDPVGPRRPCGAWRWPRRP